VRVFFRDMLERARAASANPKTKSFAVVAVMFPALLLLSVFASWHAIELVNETRAYAVGEGRYSKAQKMAVLDLYRYAHSESDADYKAFLEDIRVPRGDEAAQKALARTPSDIETARRGFLAGNNHPSDIDGLVTLYRRFHWWQPFAEAVDDWRIADEQIEELVAQGLRLHAHIVAGKLDEATRSDALRRIGILDAAITERENTFSTHMGEASRLATTLVILGIGIVTILLWAIGIALAVRLLRRQIALDQQLCSSEQRFRDYAEVASDWYWETDAGNTITYVSLPNGGLGTDAVEFIHKRANDAGQGDETLRAIEERRPFRGLSLRLNRTHQAISGKPRFAEDGTFLGYRGVGTDITAQVNDAFALREAKERAEVANRAKSEFLANMSHELRTPLNAILGFSDIIKGQLFGRDVADRYSDYANDIHKSGSHLLSIINDILDLSKIEAGQVTLSDEERTLASLVDEARTLLGDKHEAAFEIVLPQPALRLRVDSRKFRQILLNLLSNAFKFTPTGGTVTLSAGHARGGGIAVTVRDTGIGIAPENIEKVLAPFGQVESAFSRRHHGTGLGLPLAKSLAELHGGTLRVESVLNEGTAVTIRLPAWRVSALVVAA
jgi:signal transduction histidine kinase